MKFSTRVVLAMLAVVFIATSIASYFSIRQVQTAYKSALDDLFQSTVYGVLEIRQAQLSAVETRCSRLARSTRLFAALQQNDREILALTTDDELREFFAVRGETSVGRRQAESYLYLNPQNEVIAPGTGLPKLDNAVTMAIKQLKSHTGVPTQRIVYIAFEEKIYEMLCTPINDADGEGFLGTLAVIFDCPEFKSMPMTGGGELKSGLMLGTQLYGGQIPNASSVAAHVVSSLALEKVQHADKKIPANANNSVAPSESVGGKVNASVTPTEFEILIDDQNWKIKAYVLNEQVPPAYFVVGSSLVPLQNAVQKLFWTAVMAGGIGMGNGIAVAFLLAFGLAKPIGQLSLLSSKVASGDYTARIQVRRRDEIGLLGERFNAMCEGLALRDKYRGVLDAVTDRTVTDQLLSGALDVSGTAAPIAVLFADIRGFTPLTNRLTPHEIVALLNDHMSAMTDVIYSHGGVVDKFVGDMVMAIFGAPLGKPDDAVRAAACAQDMLRVRQRLNKDLKNPFDIGIGVAFGVIIVGCMGSKKRLNYTVLGERVNLGARLCSMAPANTAYIDQGVRQYLDSTFTVAELPPLNVKGFENAVQAYELSVEQNNPTGAPL